MKKSFVLSTTNRRKSLDHKIGHPPTSRRPSDPKDKTSNDQSASTTPRTLSQGRLSTSLPKISSNAALTSNSNLTHRSSEKLDQTQRLPSLPALASAQSVSPKAERARAVQQKASKQRIQPTKKNIHDRTGTASQDTKLNLTGSHLEGRPTPISQSRSVAAPHSRAVGKAPAAQSARIRPGKADAKARAARIKADNATAATTNGSSTAESSSQIAVAEVVDAPPLQSNLGDSSGISDKPTKVYAAPHQPQSSFKPAYAPTSTSNSSNPPNIDPPPDPKPLTRILRKISILHLPQTIHPILSHPIRPYTPLIIDRSRRADLFFQYSSEFQGIFIEAKKILLDTLVHKRITMDETLASLRQTLVAAMKYGRALIISLSDSATDFRTRFTHPDFFPAYTVMTQGGRLIAKEENWKKVVREGDLENGCFVVREGFCVIVTSMFLLEDYEEFLRGAVPLEEMCPVYVKPEEGGEV
ncbi:hypothetical protein HDV00_006372 [Rhizophlyctis rosea]|nr:hypothetical protein HDV00_006372 [Rhizophlyctis rosea]